MEHNQSTLTAKQTTSPNGESQDKEIVHTMSEKQQQQVEQHILNALVITEHIIELFKNETEQRACIVMETLDILPKLESNLGEAFEIINP